MLTHTHIYIYINIIMWLRIDTNVRTLEIDGCNKYSRGGRTFAARTASRIVGLSPIYTHAHTMLVNKRTVFACLY